MVIALSLSSSKRPDRDEVSGKFFHYIPSSNTFLWSLGNDDVNYEVIYSVIIRKFRALTERFLDLKIRRFTD